MSVATLFASPVSWVLTILWAAGWCALMLAYSPLADRLASLVFKMPPTLKVFRGLQQSKVKLALGLIIAWVLGGFIEETIFRAVVLTFVEAHTNAPFAILVAALGAGACHFYQGQRAMLIITQLSILFGILFVITGHNLWAVILAHGFYDTVAFIRFATGRSRYSKPDAA